VQVNFRAKAAECIESVSIRSVSNTNGFNQVDKRWLSDHAKLWKMPAYVFGVLMLFIAETEASQVRGQMFLDEPEASTLDSTIALLFETK
jgi:R.HinP1I restriction endonuclease